MFKQSIFIRKNTPELRDKLKELGYCMCPCVFFKDSVWLYISLDYSFLTSKPTIHSIGHVDEEFTGRKTVQEELDFFLHVNSKSKNPYIDCGTNEELFIALASLRNDTDRNQWFICQEEYISTHTMELVKVGTWQMNTQYDKLTYGLKRLWRKASVQELIEHFTKK